MPTSTEVAARYGVTERHARRMIANRDPRVSNMERPRCPQPAAKDKDPSECLDALYRELETITYPLVAIQHYSLAQFERCPDDPNLQALVAEITADLHEAEKLANHCYGKIIKACRKHGWRPAALGDLKPWVEVPPKQPDLHSNSIIE